MSVPCDIFLRFFMLRVTLSVLKIFLNLVDGLGYLFFQDLLLPFVRGGSSHRSDPVLSFIYHFWKNIVGHFLWDTSIQVTPPFRRHKTWSRKNVHIISVFVTCILGPENWVSPPFRRHLSNQKVTDLKIVDNLKCSLVTMPTAFKTRVNSSKSMSCACGNSTHNIAEISWSWFFIHYPDAWNNDCSRFKCLREQTPFPALIKRFYLLVNYQLIPAQLPSRGPFAMVPRMSHE